METKSESGIEPVVRARGVEDSSGTGPRFESLVVMDFEVETPQETVDWVLSKLVSPHNSGGGQLLAIPVNVDADGKKKVTVHISGTTDRLLSAAELMELKKEDTDGLLREISMDDIKHFKNSDDLDSFLTQAEKQRIIKHEIDFIRALDSDTSLPGVPKVDFYKGESIIPKLVSEKVITRIYPLHNKEALKILGTEWYRALVKDQPIAKIREYFGETVAMYFAFLGTYTMALVPPALIGIFSVVYHSVYLQVFFSVFNIVWTTFFLEVWKRNSATFAYKWGTIGTDDFEEARPEYHGELGVNKVTGRLEPKYPKWKRMWKYYGVSVPVVLFCLWIAFNLMLFYFWMQDKANLWYKESPNFLTSANALMVPSMTYAIIIYVGNIVFRKIAKALNDWENHRLQSAYDNHLIVKLLAFDFVNCFLSLFYVAFYLQDLKLLRSHLASLLIVTQLMGQIFESVVPYLIYKKRKKEIKDKAASRGIEQVGPSSAIDPDTKLHAEIQGAKDEFSADDDDDDDDETKVEFKDTMDDYLEMFLQFGYVFLFSSVFPAAAFWALLNNVTEIRSDAFKLCRIYQRPFSHPAANIGAWQIAFEMMGALTVVTNCAIIALSPQLRDFYDVHGTLQVLAYIVIAEHVLLFLKVMISYMIPDEPEWVETAVARVRFESKQAWRNERILAGKRRHESRSKSTTNDEKAASLIDL